ncbi:hypothetical protein [Natronorubrum halalkaliphilum]|nr:hypothetical protein [Natronorubrum halalkaliphilum]
MAFAFAHQERKLRNVEDSISLVTGGTQPADEVHPEVVESMRDVVIDISEQSPREVSVEELQASDYVVTMGVPMGMSALLAGPVKTVTGMFPIQMGRVLEKLSRYVMKLTNV